ncbi:MAG: IS21 family transposase [Dehalococcoidia bacterium]
MEVSLWAEIRRLHEIEGLSRRAIASRLRCSRRTVTKALTMGQAVDETTRVMRGSILDPYKPRIDALVARFPQLSAVRVCEEIRKGSEGYQGSVILVRRYLRTIRPARGRVYQEVDYEPGQAMQVDWGNCGQIKIGSTTRKVSVFVAVLCYSRLCYIEFALSQRKAEFYRAIVHALNFFRGSPRRIIFDNLKAAVVNGSGKHACLHPEFLALCGHYYLETIACQRRDPESKGTVEGHVRYVKQNALAGRSEELIGWDDYRRLATTWRDDVANLRIHATTRQRPVDRFEEERSCLRVLPAEPFDTDEIVAAVVTSHARVCFDANRYSVPPQFTRKPVTVRASEQHVRLIYEGRTIASHARSYDRGQTICQTEHQLQALQMRHRTRAHHLEDSFDALGEVARQFHLKLRTRPIKTTLHLRRLLNLVRLYGRAEVLAAIARAYQYETYDAAYVESIVLQERRRRELISRTLIRPTTIVSLEPVETRKKSHDQT